ncbi:MAG: hypothetical protein ABS948_14595 [Solibacillus sp.]
MKAVLIKYSAALLLVALLSACSNANTLFFVGESEHWIVRYEAVIHSSNSEETIYRFEYVGDEAVPFEVEYLRSGHSQKGKTVIDEQGKFNTGISSCTGCAITDESEEISMIIWWNDQMETIELTLKK